MQTIVFDLDGTLADTSGDLLAAANACFRALGHKPPLGPDDALTAFHGGRAMLRLGFSRVGESGIDAAIEAQFPLLLENYRRAIDVYTFLYPGVVEAIETLRSQGYKTVICTNKPEALAHDLVARLGIAALFDSLIGADTLAQRKPDPAPYRAAVERAGGEAARSILIGDTQTDRDTARAAGVPIVLVTFGPEGEDIARLKPDALLSHYNELPALVPRLL